MCLCLYLYLCLCVCVSVSLCLCVPPSISISVSLSVSVFVFVFVSLSVFVFVSLFVFVFVFPHKKKMTQNHPLVYGVHGEREEVGDADVDEHRAPLRHHPAGRVQLYRTVLHLNRAVEPLTSCWVASTN